MPANEEVVETHNDHEIVLNRDTGERRKRRRFKEDDVVSRGQKIILPAEMETAQAIACLKKKLEQEEEMMEPNLPISCFPFDGLVAFGKAIRKVFGFAAYKPIVGFFGSQPPSFISIPISDTETIECPIGEIHIPGIAGHLMLQAGSHNKKPALVITGQVRNKDFPKVKQLAEETKAFVAAESIYRGKAIQLGIARSDRPRDRDGNVQSAANSVKANPPIFLRVDGLDEQNLILPRTIADQVKYLLWTPVERTEVCRDKNVPLKRGVLLAGSYGTGKSLTGAITMKKAIDNGWTFISLADADLLTIAIDMASWYQPAVIFAEDVDQIVGSDERNPEVNALLNAIDGIDKSKEIMVLVTTNHAEKINRAMLRPGRLDAVITLLPPDAEASERLLRLYAVTGDGKCLIPEDEDIKAAAEVMAGAPASMVREVVERAKLAAIGRSGSAEQVSGGDLKVAADNLQDHLQLMRSDQAELPIHPAIAAAGKSLGTGLILGLANSSDARALQDRISKQMKAIVEPAQG